MLQLQSPNNVYPAAMDAPVSMALSTLQLWMLQCQWHGRHCSYGCSSVSGMVNPAAMDAPVSVAWSTLQLWMLQCQWHGQHCSYGCSSVSGMVNPAAMDVPVSVAWSTQQLWMFQCQRHGQDCSYGCSSVSGMVNTAAMDAPVSMSISEDCMAIRLYTEVNGQKCIQIHLDLLKSIPINCQTSNMSHTLVGNKIVDHWDVVGAPPVSAAPIASSFST